MSSQDAGETSLPILQGPLKHKDPVCGMTVVPEKAAAKIEHGGKIYCFCSKGCAGRFSREPEKFLAASGTAEMDHGSVPRGHGTMEHSRATASLAAADEKKI